MLYSDVQLLEENPSWRLVLEAYEIKTLETAAARAAERKKAKAEQADTEEPSDEADDTSTANDRWLNRIQEIEGVLPEDLSNVHGNLIAHGFLKFRLSGRDGLVYQLTSLCRRAGAPTDENVDDDDSLEDAA